MAPENFDTESFQVPSPTYKRAISTFSLVLSSSLTTLRGELQ